MAVFETERLVLRPLKMSDAPAIQSKIVFWEITKYLGKRLPWPYPADGAVQFLQFAISAMLQGTEIFWAITEKHDPEELVGVISLRDQDTGSGNIGFWLSLSAQGKGYMTEATSAIYNYAFNTLGFDKLMITNAAENKASSRVHQKAGARLLKTHENDNYLGGFKMEEVWELTPESFNSRLKKSEA